jgi:hypothetical protein
VKAAITFWEYYLTPLAAYLYEDQLILRLLEAGTFMRDARGFIRRKIIL